MGCGKKRGGVDRREGDSVRRKCRVGLGSGKSVRVDGCHIRFECW